ncbi:energy transducer TonB [Pontibacter pamirensis]|uniref:energy transducer TonB n=1 Tax=Pontibacter pamirensis TaxID=2562824 RepID=UPI00138A0D05|nr:energy transducer TonB [Pontibacter pamirensis]
MKQTLLLLLMLLLGFSSVQAQQEVPIYYNHKWEVTKRETAVFTRLAFVPDSLIKAGSLFEMAFDKTVADYYDTGQIMARGIYVKGQKQGIWLFYHPNGQIMRQGSYENNKPIGTWKFWRENGKPLQEVVCDRLSVRFQNFWDDGGKQTVAHGTGTYVALLPGENNSQMQLKGNYINGVRHGTWQYAPVTADRQEGKPLIEQVYNKGMLVKGYIYAKGKKISEYTAEDKFNLSADLPYLAVVEKWAVDTNAFKPGYPVLAHVLKLDVQEVQENSGTQQYQVILQTGLGADTLKLAKQPKPGTMPAFSGGEEAMFRFLGKNIRYPAAAQRAGIQGIVLLSLAVAADGTIEDVKVLQSVNPLLDNESIRVVKLMPKWEPALSNGVPVAASFIVPVSYRIVQQPQQQQQYNPSRRGF